MKKLLISFLAIGSSLSAGLIPEIRVSYLYFTDSTMRDIFSSGNVYPQIGAMYPLCNSLYAWGSVGYFTKDGRSIGEGDHTSIRLIPVNLGLRYFIPCIDWLYVEGGGNYFNVGFTNDSNFVLSTVYRNGGGAFVGVGGLWRFARCVSLDVFTEYSYRRTPHGEALAGNEEFQIDVGGWDFGAGIVFNF